MDIVIELVASFIRVILWYNQIVAALFNLPPLR